MIETDRRRPRRWWGKQPLPDEAARLAGLHVRTGLKLPDCGVLDAAMENAAEVATFDDRLAAVAKDLGLSVATG